MKQLWKNNLRISSLFSGHAQALCSPQSLPEKEPSFLKNHFDTGPDVHILENCVVVAAVSPF